MRLRAVVAWVFVAVVAAGAYFYSVHTAERREQAREEAARAVSLGDPLNVTVVELKGRDYPRPVRIVRQDQKYRWFMEKPVAWPADNLMVGRLIGAVLDAKAVRKIPHQGNLEQYGLKPPRIEITLTDRKGGRATLLIGDLSPTGKFCYAMRPGAGEVLFLPGRDRAAFSYSVFRLRDKAVLDFVISDVERLELAWGEERPMVIRRVRGGAEPVWRFADGAEASAEAVEDFLMRLHGLRAVDYVDRGLDLPEMGLQPPRGRMVLGIAGGEPVGILIGGKVPGREERYLRRLEGGPAIVVKAKEVEGLRVTRHQLAERRVWRIDRERAVALEVRRGGKSLAYAKEEGAWRRTRPPGDTKAGTAAPLLIWDLSELKYEKLLPPGDYGLDPPQARITLTLEAPAKEGKGRVIVRRLRLGRVDPATGLLAVQVEGDGRIFGVKPKIWDSLPPAEGGQVKEKD